MINPELPGNASDETVKNGAAEEDVHAVDGYWSCRRVDRFL